MRQPPVRRMDDTVFTFEMGRVGMESMEKYKLAITVVLHGFDKV